MRLLAEQSPERLARCEHLDHGALRGGTAASRDGVATDPNPPVHHAAPQSLAHRGAVRLAIGQIDHEIGCSVRDNGPHTGAREVSLA